jgi:hypothetical protein
MEQACDVFFDVHDLDKDGRFEIVSSGFFISELNIIYSEDPDNNFLNNNVKKRTIDDKSGQFFDIKIADLDKKGNLEILVTNHQGNSAQVKGALFFYTFDGNIRNGTFIKNMIFDNFPVLKSGFNQAAPGSAKLFYPNLKNQDERLHIMLSGDGAEYAYYFEPTAIGTPLKYNLVWNQLFSNTVGGIDIADIDNDGFSECIIPIYENNICYLLTFA